MEPIVTIVGFLGAGKTTLLRHLVERCTEQRRQPFVILNDYASAELDAQRLSDGMPPGAVRALTGSCIGCDGIDELRDAVNGIPPREQGMTLIEANGTSDAPRLMEFLGVGLDERFRPPVQVSVVDVKNWQRRGLHDELEAEQVRFGSLVLLTHLDGVPRERVMRVEADVRALNPLGSVVTTAELDARLLSGLEPVEHGTTALRHSTTHWSSCSVDLPDLPDLGCIERICESIPPEILRVKGCTRIGRGEGYVYLERCPDGQVHVRPYHGAPTTGPKLLSVGPGSAPTLLREAVARGLASASGGAEPDRRDPRRSGAPKAAGTGAPERGG